jgi:undecaprenyl-diphosphatase
MNPEIKKSQSSATNPRAALSSPPASGLDQRLFVVFRTRGHWRPLELVMIVFSTSGNWGLFWVGLAVVFWLGGATRGRALIIFLPVFIYLTLLVNFIIKVILQRQRPLNDDPSLRPLVGVPSSKSFPSSHAAMSFVAAIVLTFFYPQLFVLFFGLASLISWSRVYVGVHYPSDVLAGTVVGLAAGALALWFFNWV